MSRIEGKLPEGRYCKQYRLENGHVVLTANCPYFIQAERICLKYNNGICISARQKGDKDFGYLKLEECINDV